MAAEPRSGGSGPRPAPRGGRYGRVLLCLPREAGLTLEFSHTVSRAPRRSPPFAALCGWVLLCFLATTAVHAETTLIIRDGELKLGENVYELDTSLVIELDEGARRAIEGGLTMRLDYEIGISRIRNYLPDDGIASLVQSYELNYHALSQRY